MYTAKNTVQGDALLVQYALSRAPDLRDRIVEAYLSISPKLWQRSSPVAAWITMICIRLPLWRW